MDILFLDLLGKPLWTWAVFLALVLALLVFDLGVLHRFGYLKTALSLVLIFIGSKVFAAELIGIEKVPPAFSLGVTAAILVGGVALSLWKTRASTGAPASVVRIVSLAE